VKEDEMPVGCRLHVGLECRRAHLQRQVEGREGVFGSVRGSAAVNFQESIPTYLDVSATPPVLPADGQSKSTLKATVSDANRNPVPNGTLVMFELVSGSGSLERQKTTSSGVATTQLTSGTTPSTVTVRIAVGSLSKDIQVVYTVGEPFQVLVTSTVNPCRPTEYRWPLTPGT
jgi:hypothetical protein